RAVDRGGGGSRTDPLAGGGRSSPRPGGHPAPGAALSGLRAGPGGRRGGADLDLVSWPVRAAPGLFMSAEPLEVLLARLNSGDLHAAEEVFRAYEPYLRKVVRRQLPARLRAKFDSDDIVQSVWADLLEGFREADWRFPTADHLRAFLVKVTRHRFIDRLRQ